MEPKEKKAFEPSGLVPRSIVRTFERFRQQLLPGSETAAIREYRISRYQVLVSVRCLFTLLIIPIATNWLVSSWLLSPLVEHFWNTQQNEIFLNSYQEERAFAELESFSEKLFFESLLNTTNIIHVNDTSVAVPQRDSGRYISSPTKMNLPLLRTTNVAELRSAVAKRQTFRVKEGLPSCALEEIEDFALHSSFDMNDLIINSEKNILAQRERGIINTFLDKDSLLAVPQRDMRKRKSEILLPLNDMTTSSSVRSSAPLKWTSAAWGVKASPSHAANLRFPYPERVSAFARENPARIAKPSKMNPVPSERFILVGTLLHKASASYIEDVKTLSTKINQLRKPFNATLVEGYYSDAPLLTGIKAKAWGTELKAPSLLNDCVILESTYDNSLKIKEKVQNKILELAIYYNQQTIISITNIVGDVVSLVTLGCLFIWMKPEITILKSFLIEAIYSLSDTTKSFLLILLTDLLVGFHSPRGWETALELLLKHFGLPENQDFVFLFVATFPVLLDTVFKYWIFRHLNKISPSTVATYHSMIE